MAVEIRLPDLGENVTGGDVVKVLVKEGDVIEPNQVVIELETDKALLEVPSLQGGRVTKVSAVEGKRLKIGDAILSLEPAAGSIAAPAEAPKPAPAKAPAPAPAAAAPPPPAPAAAKPAAPPPSPASPPPAPPPFSNPEPAAAERPAAQVVEVPRPAATAPIAASPSIRKLARELGVEISEVKGTGPGGRIGPEDVKEFVKRKFAPPPPPAPPARPAAPSGDAPAPTAAPMFETPPLPDFSQWGEIERKPMSGIRKRTMEQLTRSWRTIPHVTQIDEVDVTDLEALRERHAKYAAAKGGKLTATVFVMKAVVAALKAFPQFNASIDPATEEIIYKNYYNLGIAVDTEHGLVVPVIRDADKKHFIDLSAELALMSERTRQRKVSLDDLRGGTFTISNLGGIGGTAFTPIINYPEVAILGLARSQKRLVMKDGKIVERTILPLCLSYDHRIIDGADGIRFTRKVAAMLEDPALLLLGP